MPQTSFPSSYTIAFEGMYADSAPGDSVSKANAEASANIAFGEGVRDSANGAIKFSGASQVLLGVVAYEQRQTAQLASTGAYAPKETMSVIRKGRVWVKAEQTIALNDPVYVRHTANGGTTAPGRFRKDADTANATLVAGARWVTTTSGADQMALLELNLPA